jgi:peptide/nickel transport system ATP-binding protein
VVNPSPVLEVRALSKVFTRGLFKKQALVALKDFSFQVGSDRATITAIAGESGSGKTTLARLILGLLTPSSGSILYQGEDVTRMSAEGRRKYRREVQAIFQDPFEVYNPFYRVEHVLQMVIRELKLTSDKAEEPRMISEALEVLGLRPDEVLGKFPHQLSGGQRQRIMVARAFLPKPKVIVADEPVSMVDASLRALILENMLRLKRDFGISFVYITHDLSTAYQISDDIYVLYKGTVAETGNVTRIIEQPKHPYTQLLVASIPNPDPQMKWHDRIDLPMDEVATQGPSVGCTFADRCPHVMDICCESEPPLYRVGEQQRASCFLYRQAEIRA